MELQPQRDIALGPLTTLGVGGPARFFIRVHEAAEVAAAVTWARRQQLRWMVLGGGSNVVVDDAGFDGLVIYMALRGIATDSASDALYLTAAAGEEWDALVEYCVERGWAGVECLSGIPGRVGATPIQNVGAYGQEVGQLIERVETYDSVLDEVKTFTNGECRFSYRDSRFKSADAGRYVVLSVTYRLRSGGTPSIRYAELARAVEARGFDAPDLRQVRGTVLAVRRGKSMVLDAADPNSRSVGSFFVNPVVTAERYASLIAAAREAGVIGSDVEPPHYPAANGTKLSAAWLIERAGFKRGYQMDRVGLSQNHALAIINRGGARAADVLRLMNAIRQGVEEKFGVVLQPEPVFVGGTQNG